MADPVVASESARLYQQQAFLLHQLAAAPNGSLTQSGANKAIPTQIKKDLGLGANATKALRKSMTGEGWVVATKDGKIESHAITEIGRLWLREMEAYLPLQPVRGSFTPPVDDAMAVEREAYVLAALEQAPDRTIPSASLALGPFKGQDVLKLNAATVRHVLGQFALGGEIVVTRGAGNESYTLTAKGQQRLAELRERCPVLPPTGRPTPTSDDAARMGREAILLLRLLESPGQTMTEAALIKGSFPKPLKLNPATAWQIGTRLSAAGHVTVRWADGGSYTLTPAGRSYLSTLSFDAFADLKVKGTTLTRLLAAARETAPTNARPADVQTVTPKALSADRLEAAVWDVFDDLVRERHAGNRMVPIHEIRREIARRHGPESATHVVFDELLYDLRRAKKVRLISIDDRSRATPDQLQDSIVGIGETFFYVVKAHALDSVG